MNWKPMLVCGSFAALCAVTGCASSAAKTPGATAGAAAAVVRVGTYDSRGVALAYGRSARPDAMLAAVKKLRADHDQAKAAGDETRTAALANAGVALQRKIHEQVFSGAPIDEILELLEADLPGIARVADVDLIVSRVLVSRPGVEVIDVTHQMCAPFAPDEQTRKLIRDLIATSPVPASELGHDH